MNFNNPVLKLIPMVMFAGFYFVPMMSSGAKLSMITTPGDGSSGPEVKLSDPALPDRRLEASRQAELYRSVNSQITKCRPLFRDDREESRDLMEVGSNYYERNEEKHARIRDIQYEGAGKVQVQLREDLQKTGDGFFGGLKKIFIIETRKVDMMEDIHQQLGGSGVRLVTGFPSEPSYAECYKFIRMVSYGKYDLKVPRG